MSSAAQPGLLPDLAGVLRKFVNLPEEPCLALERYCETIAASPELAAVWGKAFEVFTGPEAESFFSGSMPEEFRTEDQGLFFLSIAAAALTNAPQHFKRNGIPEWFLHDGMADFRNWVDDYHKNYHAWGLEFDHGFAWMVLRIFRAEVLRFGRLEYNKSSAFPEYLFFRSRKTGAVRILLNAECDCNQAGLPALPGEAVAFRTHLVRGIFWKVTGFPVLPDGSISSICAETDLEEFEPALLPCEPSLYLHIPADGPLEEKACRDSLRDAMDFYRKHDEHFQPKAVICGSWLFDPVLRELLPEDSNIIKLWKLGHLLPSLKGTKKSENCDAQSTQENPLRMRWKKSSTASMLSGKPLKLISQARSRTAGFAYRKSMKTTGFQAET